MLDNNNKLVNKRSVSDVELNSVNDESDADHWLWGHVDRIKRSINSLLQQEQPKHSGWRKQHSVAVGSKNNRLRRDYGDDHEDNEIDVGADKDLHGEDDEDDIDVDDDDDDVPGSGFLYEEATDVYSLKPSRLCKLTFHALWPILRP